MRVGRIIIVTLLWSEIMGGYNTPDTMVIGRDRSVKVGHEINLTKHCTALIATIFQSLCI